MESCERGAHFWEMKERTYHGQPLPDGIYEEVFVCRLCKISYLAKNGDRSFLKATACAHDSRAT